MIYIEFLENNGRVIFQHFQPTDDMLNDRPSNSLVVNDIPEPPLIMPSNQYYELWVNTETRELYYKNFDAPQPPKELTLEEKTDQMLLNTEYLVIMQELNTGGI